MRDLRTLHRYAVAVAPDGGSYTVPSPIDRAVMVVIASFGGGWDHVSVSRKNRCPNWTEMEFVKRLFFRDDEVAMQLHVPPAEHISMHPYVLHIWRPQHQDIPRPPALFVGVGTREARDAEDAEAMMREAGL